MKELDLSAGGFPERTYVGKNTTVADVVEYIRNMRAQHVREIERARLEAKIEALDDLWCTTKRYERGRTEECAWMVGVTPYSVRMDVETLAAALAALEAENE